MYTSFIKTSLVLHFPVCVLILFAFETRHWILQILFLSYIVLLPALETSVCLTNQCNIKVNGQDVCLKCGTDPCFSRTLCWEKLPLQNLWWIKYLTTFMSLALEEIYWIFACLFLLEETGAGCHTFFFEWTLHNVVYTTLLHLNKCEEYYWLLRLCSNHEINDLIRWIKQQKYNLWITSYKTLVSTYINILQTLPATITEQYAGTVWTCLSNN